VSDSVWVNVELILEVMVPNIFTPNNDGTNDRFYLIGKGIESYSLRIFDRWGRLIYDKAGLPANDKTIGWDGTENGKKVPSDTYIYQAVADFVNGTRKVAKGEVILVR
ncbi:MAG: gliding motility-associated C-terminal domain-containing protein, partial [Bacteroidetes bacterium]